MAKMKMKKIWNNEMKMKIIVMKEMKWKVMKKKWKNENNNVIININK